MRQTLYRLFWAYPADFFTKINKRFTLTICILLAPYLIPALWLLACCFENFCLLFHQNPLHYLDMTWKNTISHFTLSTWQDAIKKQINHALLQKGNIEIILEHLIAKHHNHGFASLQPLRGFCHNHFSVDHPDPLMTQALESENHGAFAALLTQQKSEIARLSGIDKSPYYQQLFDRLLDRLNSMVLMMNNQRTQTSVVHTITATLMALPCQKDQHYRAVLQSACTTLQSSPTLKNRAACKHLKTLLDQHQHAPFA